MANRATKGVSALVNSFRRTPIKDAKGEGLICTISEVNPGMKHLVRKPSHVRYGNTRYSNIPEENGKNI